MKLLGSLSVILLRVFITLTTTSTTTSTLVTQRETQLTGSKTVISVVELRGTLSSTGTKLTLPLRRRLVPPIQTQESAVEGVLLHLTSLECLITSVNTTQTVPQLIISQQILG